MKSAFSRTFCVLAVVLLTALLVVGVSFQYLVRDYLTDRTLDKLKSTSDTVVSLAQSGFSDRHFSGRDFQIALTVASSVSDADAVICNSSGVLLMCADSPLGCEHTGMILDEKYLQKVLEENGHTHTGIIEGLYPDTRYVISTPVRSPETGNVLGVVIVSSPIDISAAMLKRISDIFLFVSLLVVLVSIVFMIIFVRRQSAPLRTMAQTARAFGHGDLTARVEVDSSHTEEIQDLALAFNNMASSLEKSEYRRQEFVANISHELKTPMTSIAGYIDGILDGTIPKEKQAHYLTLVSSETKRLNRLVRSMLDISRLQNQEAVPEDQKLRFDLCESLGLVLISFEQKINEKQLDVQVDMPDHPVFTLASQDAIHQVIYNLVDNAVKFCPQGEQITLDLREGSNKAYVSIGNRGQTIPPEELPLVFDRFHKIDKSRALNRDSWGLGLYIVKTILDSHGENISVTSRDGTTTFTFTLPLVN
ncbi:MAG: HAMP domain-containing histidine kinase [Oscillospiraceae bacterium]|nr:HAMP domain-containing histidine kinase [Oscillospiraceae bacterium]